MTVGTGWISPTKKSRQEVITINAADYSQLLAHEIEVLDAHMKALLPDWDVPNLKLSYTESEVNRALRNFYDAAA